MHVHYLLVFLFYFLVSMQNLLEHVCRYVSYFFIYLKEWLILYCCIKNNYSCDNKFINKILKKYNHKILPIKQNYVTINLHFISSTFKPTKKSNTHKIL